MKLIVRLFIGGQFEEKCHRFQDIPGKLRGTSHQPIYHRFHRKLPGLRLPAMNLETPLLMDPDRTLSIPIISKDQEPTTVWFNFQGIGPSRLSLQTTLGKIHPDFFCVFFIVNCVENIIWCSVLIFNLICNFLGLLFSSCTPPSGQSSQCISQLPTWTAVITPYFLQDFFPVSN